MWGLIAPIRNMLQHDNPADPGSPPQYGTQNRFQPDFAAGAANMAAKPRFGPNSAPYAGMEKFNDSGERFGMSGAGFDPMLRQRLLSQNLRGPGQSMQPPMQQQPMSAPPMPMSTGMPQQPPMPQRMPQPGMGGGGFSQMMNRMGGNY